MKKSIPHYAFVLIIFMTGFIASCKSTAQILNGTDLSPASTFLQKEIPGEEHLKVKDFLHINFENYNTDECTIDSIYYLNKVFRINNQKLNYKLLLDTGINASDTNFISFREDMASIFYHKQNYSYYITIDGIVRKNSIYLP